MAGITSKPATGRITRIVGALCIALSLGACATSEPRLERAASEAPVGPPASGDVLARNDRFVIYQVAPTDTFASIARRFLGNSRAAWRIEDFGDNRKRFKRDGKIVVPLVDTNPGKVFADRFQTVPILCYHRFGPGKSKMIVSGANFARQMAWLARNDYRVISLAELEAFLDGRGSLPERAVVLTIDDGYKTVYEHAFPVLKKYGFPATIFLYTDFVGAGDALSWKQMREMVDSGLIDIQAHSKSHANLMKRGDDESPEAYTKRVSREIEGSRRAIEAKLPVRVRRFAYPYGDANQTVLDLLDKHDYALGLTVNPGGNGFFAERRMLRRTMIYGDHSLAAFKARTQVSRAVSNP